MQITSSDLSQKQGPVFMFSRCHDFYIEQCRFLEDYVLLEEAYLCGVPSLYSLSCIAIVDQLLNPAAIKTNTWVTNTGK